MGDQLLQRQLTAGQDTHHSIPSSPCMIVRAQHSKVFADNLIGIDLDWTAAQPKQDTYA